MKVIHCVVAPLGATFLVGTVWVAASVVYFPFCRINVEKGQALFEKRCAACHSLNPTGGSSYGPNLGNAGATAAKRVPGLSAEEYLLQSIIHPDAYRDEGEHSVMPANISAGLDAEEVLSIVGYLTTRGGKPDWKRLVALIDKVDIVEPPPPSEIDFLAVESGRLIFQGKGKCIDCHPLKERPGFDLRAPSLLTAGRHHEDYLRESICRPSNKITYGYTASDVVLQSGRTLSGRIMQQRSDSFELMTTSSEILEVVNVRYEDVEQDDDGRPMILNRNSSAMPNGFETMLTEQDIDQLIAFLKTLR